jgi:hypothetical protein
MLSKSMNNFYSALLIIVIIFSTVPLVSNAGFLTSLFGLGSYEDCTETGLKKALTSRAIKEIYDTCKKEYPDERIIQGSNDKGTSLPSIPIPRVPVVSTPLVPVVPTPSK